MRYLVTVEQQTLLVEVERSADGNYRVSGEGGPELRVSPFASHPGLVSLLVAEQVFEVQPLEGEVRYRQELFTVHVDDFLEQSRARSVANGGDQQRLLASMPGRIVRVLCQAGSVVEDSTPLIVIEAMKMQNELCASAHATVHKVHVGVGQTVERGALLIEFE
jgi:biotin carboxyl carrier protein